MAWSSTSYLPTCHGEDGRLPTQREADRSTSTPPPTIPEFIHKVRFGQPGPMPSLFDAGWSLQDVLDLLAHAQGLPTD
jgi:hypothetical protein